MIRTLVRLPGFRNVLVHEYVSLDFDRVIEALEDLGPVEAFAAGVAALVERGEV